MILKELENVSNTMEENALNTPSTQTKKLALRGRLEELGSLFGITRAKEECLKKLKECEEKLHTAKNNYDINPLSAKTFWNFFKKIFLLAKREELRSIEKEINLLSEELKDLKEEYFITLQENMQQLFDNRDGGIIGYGKSDFTRQMSAYEIESGGDFCFSGYARH